ncbi:PLAT domain-containing protein 3-like [Salvia miltiorrhiza]|uniref:PLAT domain-containing protein 3-like n=1 Tax=Salvia miltiorrhiza TaxID=226208 RepID=UPI0025ACA618|nr:PLAT domain-containing protein 3-like [Salvia miltiorrhiza]
MEIKHLSFSFLILFSFIIYTNANSKDCFYNIYVETGDIPSAGTKSNVTIFLGDENKDELPIVNLKDWGLMGPTHSYLSVGEVDLFAGKGPCLRGPICSLIIVLDGYDTWFCDSIEITSVGFGKSCSQKHFVVKQWLDVNKGSALILQDECSTDYDGVPLDSMRSGY